MSQEEPTAAAGGAVRTPFFLFRWLRQIWDVQWGEVTGTSRALGVLSATAGLFVWLVVAAVVLLQHRGFYQLVWDFVERSVAERLGLDALLAVALATASLLALALIVAGFGGMIIWLSSSPIVPEMRDLERAQDGTEVKAHELETLTDRARNLGDRRDAFETTEYNAYTRTHPAASCRRSRS